MVHIREQAIDQAMDDWASFIAQGAKQDPSTPIALVGLISHGDILAQRLIKRLAEQNCQARYGALDITLYRDDLSMQSIKPALRSTYLPFSTDGMKLILIDDVVYTGRTIRAALNAIFDYGRPAKVELHCLAERQGRELPIQPNFSAFRVTDEGADGVTVQLSEIDEQDSISY